MLNLQASGNVIVINYLSVCFTNIIYVVLVMYVQLNPDNSNYLGTEEFVRVIRFSSYRGFR